MEKTFGQICDFQYRRAEKLENSSYLEELTGLLAKVASSIPHGTAAGEPVLCEDVQGGS